MNNYNSKLYNLQTTNQNSFINKLFHFSVLAVMVLALNNDWGSSGIVWWSSVALLIVSFLFISKSILLHTNYTIWRLSFAFFSFISFLWATDIMLVTTALKSLFVHTVIVFIICSTIKTNDDISKILNLLFVSIIINSVYLLIANASMLSAQGGNDIYLDRLGSEGDWNSNTIGHMASVGMLISLFLYKKEPKKIRKVFYLFIIVLTIFTTLITGSRSALFKLLVSLICFLFLSSKGKRFRITILILLLIIVFYYLVMKVPFFYSIIGYRLEGLFALITGVGQADNSADLRQRFLQDAFIQWQNRPILGYGLDCYRTVNTVQYGMYAHNNFVEILADLGIVGFCIYYSAYVSSIIKIFKIKTHDTTKWMFVSFLIASFLTDFGSVTYNSIFTHLLIMLSFTYISVNNARKEEQK